MTPKEAVRKFCTKCVGNNSLQVRNCGGSKMLAQGDDNGQCFFYPYRNGKGRPSVKLIRKFCLECMGGIRKLVRMCGNRNCPLHQYRFGTNPKRTGIGREKSEEEGVEQGVFVEI